MNERQGSSSESSSESIKLDDLEKKGLLYNALPALSVLLSSKLSPFIIRSGVSQGCKSKSYGTVTYSNVCTSADQDAALTG
jgi:hypothetical protein